VQAYDRYAYGNNNPIRYTDPTGHWVCDGLDCEAPKNLPKRSRRGGFQKGPEELPTLDDRIWWEIDKRFDPFNSSLPGFEGSALKLNSFLALEAYEKAGYDLMQIASEGRENPMTEMDWFNAGVDIDYIYVYGVRGKSPGVQFFLDVMDIPLENPSNFEPNYVNALMITHQDELKMAKTRYYDSLKSIYTTPLTMWEFLQMEIGVAGPDS
jgi:hypothetical protein